MITTINKISLKNLNEEHILKLFNLYEKKGNENVYLKLSHKDNLKYTRTITLKNVLALAKLLQLRVSESRIKLVFNDFSKANNEAEILIRNISDVLIRLETSQNDFIINEAEIRDLTILLSNSFSKMSYSKDEQKNFLNNDKIKSKQLQLDGLCSTFNKILLKGNQEKIHLIANFYIDFINNHFYVHSNKLLGLLILYSFIFKNFKACKYSAFLTYIVDDIDTWKSIIKDCDYEWKNEYNINSNLAFFITNKLILVMDEANLYYRSYEIEARNSKSDDLENTISKLASIFSKDDIRKHHPTISKSTIDRKLNDLKEKRLIMPVGTGRSAKWQKLDFKDNLFDLE